MKKTENGSVVDRIIVVVPEFRQWTGTRAMHEGDFFVGANGKLPPKEVTKSLGLKAIIDLVHLRRFDRIKHRAEALLSSCGVQYLSGWAIPEEKSSSVLKELDNIVQLYEDAKTDFLKNYDKYVDEWARQNPSFSREILDGKLDRNALAMRFAAGYEAFRLQPVTDEKADALEKSVGGLAGDLIDDVSQCARVFFRESFLGKTRANRKTVNALIRIRERLDGLSFLSRSISPLVQIIDDVVAQMPQEGYFDGDAFWKLSSLVQTLADKKLLEEIIQKKISLAALENSTENGASAYDASESQEQVLESKTDSQSELLFGEPMPVADEESLEGNEEGENLSLATSASESHGLLQEEHSKEPGEVGFAKSQEALPVEKGEDALPSDSSTTTGEISADKAKASSPVILPCVDIGEGLFF